MNGKIYEACGSGGMFVQSFKFIEDHQKNASNAISIYGQERVDETLRLAKMNMAYMAYLLILNPVIRITKIYTTVLVSLIL